MIVAWLMQARSSATGALIGWRIEGAAADWRGLKFPGPGSPEYIAGTPILGAVTSEEAKEDDDGEPRR